MEKRTFSKLVIAILSLVGLSSAINAQDCSIGNTNENGRTSSWTAAGQQFVACDDGSILEIHIWYASDRGPLVDGLNRRITIFDGQDPNAPELYSQVIEANSLVEGENIIVLDQPVEITNGEMNFFNITLDDTDPCSGPAGGDGIKFSNNNDYADGIPIWGCSTEFSFLELAFQVNIGVVDTKPLPSIPRGLLVALGIIFIAVGVFGYSRLA